MDRSPRRSASPARPSSASSPPSRPRISSSRRSLGEACRIGPGLARIAASLGSNSAELLRPHLVALSERVGETVDLSVLSGGSAVFVDQIPGRQRLVAVSAVGERFPLHCTANGKAILACFASEDAALLIQKSVAAHEDHPLKDRNKLLKRNRGRATQTSRFLTSPSTTRGLARWASPPSIRLAVRSPYLSLRRRSALRRAARNCPRLCLRFATKCAPSSGDSLLVRGMVSYLVLRRSWAEGIITMRASAG